ncbi:hypothetical protein AaE_015934 [Aphanomyces astaci]|uniref:Retrotransposon gag domain-containing protein n=1 Tax=Aphanomyces astaci TaxID=112090 RepID=A0A6A4Z0L2_APHAT|nr:hypothetical protein AaE_015934 [Aphanomyces astaci]
MEEVFARLVGTMEQQQMIQQLLEAQTQAQAQVLTNQQAQQENQLKTQQDVQEALLRCVSSNGDQGRSQPRDTERHVEGLSMPAYHEHLNESIVHHRVKTFFAAKNLKYETDEAVEARCLAMVVANLQGQSAAWYQELALQGHDLRHSRNSNTLCVQSSNQVICKSGYMTVCMCCSRRGART